MPVRAVARRTRRARSSAATAGPRSPWPAQPAAATNPPGRGSAVSAARACGACATASGAGRARRVAAERRARVGAVRRSRRLHDAVGVARRRGGPRAALPLLRHVPPADRPVRRHGGEVHRRRGDGGLGDADARPRTTPSGRSVRRSTWSPRCRRSARRSGARAARARRRADRRGGRDDRRRGRGDGRRRPGQHRLADAVGRRAGHRLVGESTRRATEQAIVYEDAGAFELKGKAGLDARSGGRCGSSRASAAR